MNRIAQQHDSLESLVLTGTKLWLDSVDPTLVAESLGYGATGATSNPAIVADLIKSGRFDERIDQLLAEGDDDSAVAWSVTDTLVQDAQDAFHSIWKETDGDNGYVSFELDPLLEDESAGLTQQERTQQYIELGRKWSAGRDNRLIKVPATPAGLASLEELAASGVQLNVTLIFTMRQYHEARDAVWRGIERLNPEQRARAKSVYSIFVSRVDVYTEQQVPDLTAHAQGQVGIVNAKRIWADNAKFWRDKQLPLAQEIVFASTGVKSSKEAAWKYVASFAGADIQTNPPATNQAVADSGLRFPRQINRMPPDGVISEIDEKVDFEHLEELLMREGVAKFADPQNALLQLIAEKRALLSVG